MANTSHCCKLNAAAKKLFVECKDCRCLEMKRKAILTRSICI